MKNDVVIKVKDIKKSFFLPHEKHDTFMEYATKPWRLFKREGEQFEVLKGINLEVKAGEFVGIMGRNGSGKSTLLKIMAEIYEPTSGKIRTKGRVVPFLELGVGFNMELTGRENVFLNGIILGMKKSFLTEKYDEIVEFAELGKFMDVPMKNFSSGMQVRLAFSIAIMADADIYILDEVLAVGDVAFQEKCFDVFNEYKKRGKTVVLVTHAEKQVKDFCDRALFLGDGKLYEYDSIEGAIEAYLSA